jgi:hypothetical protein
LRRTAIVPALLLVLFSVAPALPVGASTTVPGFNDCPAYGDLHICSGEVPSFDGTLLDTDLTLPMTAGDLHPLAIMLHGFGNNKHEWESVDDQGDNADKWHWNNHWFAEHGYYVLTYTARGFNDPGKSAAYEPATPGGSSALPPSAGPDKATIHIKSKEFEIKDTQYLAGLAALAFPDLDRSAVVVTGGSYGGGESWLQASLAASSTTAGGQPAWSAFPGLPALQLQVAVPKYSWTDLAYALAPNGHGGGPSGNDIYESSQGMPTSFEADENPFGVAKMSYVLGLYGLGTATGRFEHAEYDPVYSQEEREDGPISTDAWLLRASQDPYPPGDPVIRQIRRGLTIYRGAYYQPDGWAAEKASGHEVAIMAISGWTDDLFEPIESFREFKYLKRLDDRWPVSVAVGDIGHPRGQNKPATWHRFNNRAWEFLSSNINGAHDRQTHVYSEPTICPNNADTDQNLDAAQQLEGRTPEALSHGTLTVAYSGTDAFTQLSGLGDPDGIATDPVTQEVAGNTVPPCRVSVTPAFTGRYSAVSNPVDRHLLYVGLGEVDVDYVQTGLTAQLDARIWDVAPDGTTLLVTKGTYRIDPLHGDLGGALRLPLFGNQWNVENGHRIRIDLAEVNAPYLVNGTTANTLTINDVRLVLPTREATTLNLEGAQTSA